MCTGFSFLHGAGVPLLTDLIRWQEKTNRELKEAADAVISAGKAKSSFLAQMSHEIRTPINAVLGMNEMILRESDDEGIKEYAANIQSAGKTLLSLINSILDFSKIEDGKMELVPVKYDVSSMINDLVNSISERAKNKGLDFVTDIDGTLPCMLFGDDVRIRQVIMNLLTNAVKYTEKGKVTLTISGKKTQDKMFLMYVSVRDTGIGIRREDREKLFESFARLDEERNRNIEGTGLGMSIVTRLLDIMGSSLQVESEYGQGSEFSFALLQEIMEEEPIGDFTERIRKSTDRNEDEKYLFAHGANILVVDDNDMNRKVAKSLMKRNGIVPDEASSGMEAIEKISMREYDIVFLDHMMPKMDGVETLKKLKEKDLIPQGCVIIALTANAVSGARDRYLESGFDDYLSKPIEVAQLERKLATWLPEGKVEWRTPGDGGKCITEKRKAENPQNKVSDRSNRLSEVKRDEFDDILEFTPDESDDIVEFAPDEIRENASEESLGMQDVLKDRLEGLGIDTEAAIHYCGEDSDFYKEVLADYTKSWQEKIEELDGCLENADWHEFEVIIHALKSTSKTIGALELSRKAFSLEEAAEKKDEDSIRKNYPEFAREYRELAEAIKKILETERG